MVPRRYGFLAVVASVLYLTYVVNPVDAIDMKCKGIDIKVNEEQIMNVKDCLKQAGAADVKGLNPENAGCFSRCVMEKKELIDAGGKAHKEKINNMIDEHVPDPIKGEWKEEIAKCLDKDGQNLKSAADDPKCMSFLPLSMCVHMAFQKVCM